MASTKAAKARRTVVQHVEFHDGGKVDVRLTPTHGDDWSMTVKVSEGATIDTESAQDLARDVAKRIMRAMTEDPGLPSWAKASAT